MEKVLVTGGSGYIAQHCIAELLKKGYSVRTSLRSENREAEVRQAIAKEVDAKNNLEFCKLDLLKDEGWDEAVAGCTYVLHVASPLTDKAPDDENEIHYFADNIDDAKTKLRAYYQSLIDGPISTLVDAWFIKIYEGSDIRGMVSVISAKFKDGVTDGMGQGYSCELDSELQQLWTDQGQTGDYRDKMVIQNTIMGLPLADGTKTAFWYYSWYVQVATNDIMYAAIKPDGYDKMIQMLGLTQALIF